MGSSPTQALHSPTLMRKQTVSVMTKHAVEKLQHSHNTDCFLNTPGSLRTRSGDAPMLAGKSIGSGEVVLCSLILPIPIVAL